ncbi:MAG: DegT/DnrJ/EryC1/StrS family aminotransferase [Candidatus Thermoplasmatota archaeon]|jgi:dTDP-4-amino-4,6-dideoxygalactose transaminase|nr:DegT/DnrJ/EryC1/StrS family aminotransferase [Candidatus Thermoplasmatota archaeon]
MIPIAKPLIGDEEKTAVMNVLNSGMLASGPRTEEFEKKFAEYVGTKYAIATTSGTTALHLGLLGLGVTKHDEVILPSFSFIATANAVLFCDAVPVFCDVDPRTFNLAPEKIEKLITKKTKAIMPVHLYGQAADMNPIQEIAQKHSVHIIGDACQAHGAVYDGKMVGSFGDVECFSFYPTKNMTTGEGGMVTTNNQEVAELIISLRNHGREKTKWGYEHGRLGYNYRMTDIGAAIGLEQLKKLPKNIQMRQKNAAYFDAHLKTVEIPYVLPKATHAYHQYTIKSKNRDALTASLKKNEIGFGIYYPQPLHTYKHLKKYAHDDLKNSETLGNEVVSLPVHPALSSQDIDTIVKVINATI